MNRTLIMGVLNVTPDSFSDGGRFLDTKAAVDHGVLLAEQGADIVDIGGESTRPGAERVSPEEEQFRVMPVVSALVRAGVTVSIDTMNASTALLAGEQGATFINDVSGGLNDYFMARAAIMTDAYFIASHWRGHSFNMDRAAIYKDAPGDIAFELSRRAETLVAAGVNPRKLILDPGLGFAKTEAHNWQMLGRLADLHELGYPLLIGASRKRFLSSLLTDDATLEERDNASIAVSVLAANAGAWGVRVHDVERTYQALRLAESWRQTDAGKHQGDTVLMSQAREAEARVNELAEEIDDLSYDLDRELAIAREMAAEERTRVTISAQLTAQASAALMMEQLAEAMDESAAVLGSPDAGADSDAVSDADAVDDTDEVIGAETDTDAEADAETKEEADA